MIGPWVFVDGLPHDTEAVVLPDDVSRHLRDVRREGDGDPLTVCDGAGRVAAAELRGDRAALVGPVRTVPRPRPSLRVLQALPKGRRFDDVVRVLTELGIDHITAIEAQRSVTRLDGARVTRARDRWTAVARAAAEQSRRPWLPVIDGPRPLQDATADGDGGVIAHVGAARTLSVVLAGTASEQATVTIAVGPEGGWTDHEVATATAAGLEPVNLGASVLRTEHAATVASAVVGAYFGRH